MRLDITRKGMIEVHDATGRLVSRNTVIEEAIEDLTVDADAHPEIELYRISYPEREVRVVPRVVVVPVPQEILVQGSAIQFIQGAGPQSFDLGAAIAAQIPAGHVVTAITPTQNLAGVTANVSSVTIDYDGSSPIGSISNVDYVVTTQPNTAELDWQGRIGGSDVVWYHDFESDREVQNFRWGTTIGSGNDPDGGATKSAYVRRIATDGIRGSCMEIIRPASNGDDSIHWIRPMAPMFSGTTTGNGRSTDDPAAGLTKRAWSPTQGGNQTVTFGYGWYQHPNYQTVDSDGHDFYVQLRVKMDPRRITGGNDAFGVGKFIWFTLCQTSLTTQEHVIWSYGYGGNDTGSKNYFRVYVHSVVGNAAFAPLDTGQSRIQPGNQSATDFSYSGGWDCLLIRIRPGVEGVTSGSNATQLQVWAATEAQIRAGQGYTASTKKIYDFTYGLSDYYGTSPSEYGLQALMLSGYNNGASFPQEFYHRYCQVIFSKAFIACPTY